MIITRTPFRISFAGGGSDLPSFYEHEPGAVLSTAIDKYIYISVMERFGSTFRVSYSKTELTDTVEQIEHPIVKACLRRSGLKRGLEIVSMADLPAQSGMGSSSSFTVGLLHALKATEGRIVSQNSLAAEACEIELKDLKEPIGKQDQYIAAHGGLQYIQFFPDGRVSVDPVGCLPETRRELGRRLVVFFTGQTRFAREVLAKQSANTINKLGSVRELCNLARSLKAILENGNDLNRFGSILNEAWQIKKSLESSISNSDIDLLYDRGLAAGALGGKLLGAGGGGFLLFFCEPHLQGRLRAELSELQEMPFDLEPEGTKIIHIGSNLW